MPADHLSVVTHTYRFVSINGWFILLKSFVKRWFYRLYCNIAVRTTVTSTIFLFEHFFSILQSWILTRRSSLCASAALRLLPPTWDERTWIQRDGSLALKLFVTRKSFFGVQVDRFREDLRVKQDAIRWAPQEQVKGLQTWSVVQRLTVRGPLLWQNPQQRLNVNVISRFWLSDCR